MYKYLIFDLDDTILDFAKAEHTAIKKVFEQNGVGSSDETVALYSKVNKRFWERFERGEIKREEIFEGRFIEFAKEVGQSLPTKSLCDGYFTELSKCGFVLDGAEELLSSLKNNYEIIGATNGTFSIQKSRIEASKIAHLFGGGIYISEVMGTQKPEKKFFDIIFNDIGSPPKNEVLVLGDSLTSDILGAANYGLDSCFVDLKNKNLKGPYTYRVTSLGDIPSVCDLK